MVKNNMQTQFEILTYTLETLLKNATHRSVIFLSYLHVPSLEIQEGGGEVFN